MARDERLGVHELVAQLPDMLREILAADSALQAVPLGRVVGNGAPLPFLFATRIASKIVFQGFRSAENRLLFGLISSQRDQKVADLRFKASVVPGETQSAVVGRRVRDRLVLPGFFRYDKATGRVSIESDDGRQRWTYRSSDDEEVIESVRGNDSVLLRKEPPERGYARLTQLISQICDWRSAEMKTVPIGAAIHRSPEGADNQLHFGDLVDAQRAMVDNLDNYLGAMLVDPDTNAPGGRVSPDVLSGGYQITSLRADVLANLDRGGHLVLKGEPNDAQQFDIRSTLAIEGEHSIVTELRVPDILTDGPVWDSICAGIVDRGTSFGRSMDAVRPRSGNRSLIAWYREQFDVRPSSNPRVLYRRVKAWLRTQYEAGRITIVRLEQGRRSDVDLVWVHGLPKSPTDEVIFIADVALDHYPDVAVRRINNVDVAAILITDGPPRFYSDTDFWEHGIDYCFRIMAATGEWFRFAERSTTDTVDQDV